ncbi:hypothetical protein [Vibrio sp.]
MEGWSKLMFNMFLIHAPFSRHIDAAVVTDFFALDKNNPPNLSQG